jgi:hypothetical protein
MGQHEPEPESFAELNRRFERAATLLGVADAANHRSAHLSSSSRLKLLSQARA